MRWNEILRQISGGLDEVLELYETKESHTYPICLVGTRNDQNGGHGLWAGGVQPHGFQLINS